MYARGGLKDEYGFYARLLPLGMFKLFSAFKIFKIC